jgi:predicted transcriptional regulator
MSTDKDADGENDESPAGSGDDGSDAGDVRERLEQEADRAVTGFDEGIVDLLSWVLDTETRARIYVYLRQHSDSTSEEVAEGTGLYPSTVREALAELHEERKVSRHKREADGAGNNPYEYAAIAPSDLVGDIVEDVQSELNTVFNLDRVLSSDTHAAEETDREPVTITVEDESEPDADDDGGADADEGSEADVDDEGEADDDSGADADDESEADADDESGADWNDGGE